MAARKEQNETAAKASVNMDELRELIALLRDNGLAELELEREDFRVRLRREGVSVSGDHGVYSAPSAPVSAPAGTSIPGPPPAPPGTHAETAPADDQNIH